MSFTISNGLILSDLHAFGITPGKSSFKDSVVEWFEGNLNNPKCFDNVNWIKKTSKEIDDYATRIWRLANRTFKSLESRNSVWWDTNLKLPDIPEDCGCFGCKPPVDNDDDIEVSGLKMRD